MAHQWYISAGDRVSGPVPSRELQAMAADGRLRPDDAVSPDGERWLPAARVKGLRFPVPAVGPAATAVFPAPGPVTPGGETDRVKRTHAVWPIARPAPPPAPAPTPDAAAVAEAAPGYEIVSVLGSGACGVVFKARQTTLDRVVALKTVKLTGAKVSQLADRFQKEAVALAKLSHPNVVSIFDFGRDGDQVFIAMELLPGEDLSKRLDRDGTVDERTAWAVARQAAAGLAHAADLGIYHRDVKPGNLFLCPMPTALGYAPDLPLVKVTDFGLALTKRAGDDDTSRLTAAGMVLGTPAYMAPEQFKTPDVDHRADIYALGLTVCQMLTGRCPFEGTVWDVMLQKARGPAPRPGPGVSDESAALIADMTAPAVADRLPDYPALLARIDALPAMAGVLVGSSAALPPVPDARPKPRKARPPRRAVLLGAGAAALLAVGGGAAALAWLDGGSDDPRPGGYGAAPPRGNYQPIPGGLNALFDGRTTDGWLADAGRVELVKDEEGVPALAVDGTAHRLLQPFENYRLVLGLDVREAKAVELTVCVSEGGDTAPRLAVRIDPATGAVFGSRAGALAPFTPLGPAVPLPPPAVQAAKPYRELRVQVAGKRWEAWLDNRILGAAADNDLPKVPELRITSDGGLVRLGTAEQDALRAEPPR